MPPPKKTPAPPLSPESAEIVKQMLAVAPSIPREAKTYSPAEAPVEIQFMDEYYWDGVSDQKNGRRLVGGGGNIQTENKAAKAMMEWRTLDPQNLTVNVYYLGNTANGPDRFLRDAATKGYGTINLCFSHGSNVRSTFNVAAALANVPNPDNLSAPLFGIGSCYAGIQNEAIPKADRLPSAPESKKDTTGWWILSDWAPMIQATDDIIRQRLKDGKKVTVNLYFGEMKDNSQTAKNGKLEWNPHPNRYGDWKW